MSMWTDRELKKLMGKVSELETKLNTLMGIHPMTAEELAQPKPEPHIDKRSREYRESVGRS